MLLLLVRVLLPLAALPAQAASPWAQVQRARPRPSVEDGLLQEQRSDVAALLPPDKGAGTTGNWRGCARHSYRTTLHFLLQAHSDAVETKRDYYPRLGVNHRMPHRPRSLKSCSRTQLGGKMGALIFVAGMLATDHAWQAVPVAPLHKDRKSRRRRKDSVRGIILRGYTNQDRTLCRSGGSGG